MNRVEEHLMRHLGVSVIALAALGAVSMASAADMPAKAPILKPSPPPPPLTWTGCYIGGNAGGLWSKTDVAWAPNPAGFPTSAATLAATAAGSISDDGFIAGGQVGCNFQTGLFVFGFEGDMNATGVSGTLPNAFPGNAAIGAFTTSTTVKSDWLATFRGRLGFTSGQWLFYVTGGGAVADARFTDLAVFPGTGTFNLATTSGTQTGWTVGGGVEWMIFPKWSVKLEYLHVDLGTVNSTSANSNPVAFPNSTIVHSHRLKEDIGRVGLNFHF